MKRGLLISGTVGLMLVGAGAKAQTEAGADQVESNPWKGPAYYVEDTEVVDGDSVLYQWGGPFPSLDACQTYRTNKYVDTTAAKCVYRASDPGYFSCFLTTACVQHANLPDDCEELSVMRVFRDRYLSRFHEGRLLIDHYYRIAPPIVERIRQAPDRERVLSWILREVRATARIIGRGESEAAIAHYAAMVCRLQQHYGVI